MTDRLPELHPARIIAELLDEAVPMIFQAVEWMIVISAVRWAAETTGSPWLGFMGQALTALLALFLTRRIISAMPVAFMIGETHGQPIRAFVANVLVAAGAVIMLYGAVGMVTESVADLAVLTAAPPENPPETPEKSVNITGGQTPIGH